MVEKLLTNWLSICLYAFLKVRGIVQLASPAFENFCLFVVSITDPQTPPPPAKPLTET